MSHRREAPFVPIVFGKEHKSVRRKIAKLVALRFAHGKSTFFDSTTYAPRYPLEVIAPALIRCMVEAMECGEELSLSVPESRLWQQMFPDTRRKPAKPDPENRQSSV
jgi:hypothetical protein